MISKFIHFITTDLWRIRLKNYKGPKFFLIRQLRIIVLAVRGFAEDKCKFRASALTFYSLLSIVPVIAMLFGIAKGFGLEERLEKQIHSWLEAPKGIANSLDEAEKFDLAEKLIEFSQNLLGQASGGFLAGIGIAFLFWAVIKVLSNIENSFNEIWGIKRGRHLGRKFSDYLSMVLVCPVLLIISSSITVAVSSQIKKLLIEMPIFDAIGPLILFGLKILPFCSVWLLFSFLLLFMPNTRVKLKSGILAGIVAGTIFQLMQLLYIKFQIVIATKYGAIYGGFATFPLFLIWLHVSWLILLFGAELAFAHQNVDTYEFEQDCLQASHSFKRKIALLITHDLVKHFCDGKEPVNASHLSHKLEIPIRLVRQVLFELVEASVISEIKSEKEDRVIAYQPGQDVEKLSIKYVIDALENAGYSNIPVSNTEQLQKLSGCLNDFSNTLEHCGANILLKNL